jgi:beta-N-acetylglucosaminidase
MDNPQIKLKRGTSQMNFRKKKRNVFADAAIMTMLFFAVAIASSAFGEKFKDSWMFSNAVEREQYQQTQASLNPTPMPTNKPIIIINKESLKKERVVQAISNNLGGVFKTKSEVIYLSAKNHNVNPMLLTAIIKWETADGTSEVCLKANNPGGINYWEKCGYEKYGWYVKYPTLDKGIEAMAYLIRNNYIDKGLTDIASIGAKYCPLNDPRDGRYGMSNAKWVPGVTKYYQKILEEAI